MQISNEVRDYARSMALDCGVDSACAFVSDKTAWRTQLYYLGNFGVSDEILDRYDHHRICDSDPFIDVNNNERLNRIGFSGFLHANHPEVARCGRRASTYWDFVSQEDIEVVGAATLRLQARLYLTIGVHSARNTTSRKSIAFERLGYRVETLQNKIAAELLASLLRDPKGYTSLLDVIAGKTGEKVAAQTELSPRETEIARLVCAGKQNKVIAHQTSLSECTVENHLRRIYQKLGIHNRAALVAWMNGFAA